MASARAGAAAPSERRWTRTDDVHAGRSIVVWVSAHARVLLWTVLAGAYLTLAIATRHRVERPGFDLLDPRGRFVESAIGAGRFDEALPSVLALRAEHPDNPTVMQWAAEVHRGLGDVAGEIATLRELARVSQWSDAVCPALPLALARAGDTGAALDAYSECAAQDPGHAQRHVDLGDEQLRRGSVAAAREAFAAARRADPEDRAIERRLSALAADGAQ